MAFWEQASAPAGGRELLLSREPEIRSSKELAMATTTATEVKQLINYRTEDGVAVVEMNDPPANTYTYEMNRQLDEAILKARMDNSVHVIVIIGVGEKFFSAGANIRMPSSVYST